MKGPVILLAGGAAVLLLAACVRSTGAPAVPDMVPLGDGLKVIGYALVAAAVVLTLGKLLP